MIEIKEIIPDIHGYTPAEAEVGGDIAWVDMGERDHFVRFGCNFTASECPLQGGIGRGMGVCDAINFQGKDIEKKPWTPPQTITVYCGRSSYRAKYRPANLAEFFPNHKFPFPSVKRYRWGKIIE